MKRLMGMRVMEKLLQRFPKKNDVVLAANNEQTLDAIEAIDATGRMKEIKVMGVDANYDAPQSIIQGGYSPPQITQVSRGIPGYESGD